MKAYVITSVILVIGLYFRLNEAARLARNCQSRWNQGAQCQKDALSRAGENDNNYPVPNDGNKKIIMNTVDDCFKNVVRCKKSPVPSAQQAANMTECFNQAKRSLVNQLEQCARKCVEDFSLPNDIYDPLTDWNYYVRAIRNALDAPASFCGLGKKKQLTDCAKRSGYDFARKPPNAQPAYVCQVDADCWYNLGPDCQNTWEYQVIPQLCQCSQAMQQQNAVKTTQSQYNSCLKSRGITNPAKDDPVLKWIDNYLRGMCANAQTHPCRRERETVSRRQTWQRSSSG